MPHGGFSYFFIYVRNSFSWFCYFSHHVREDIARFHDKKSIQVLDSGTQKDFGSIEVDCPNCLWVGKKIAENVGKHFFDAQLRTSVDTIMGGFSDIENTSHIFGEFVSEQRGEHHHWEFFLFISAEDFENPDFRNHFYQHNNPKLPLSRFIHRISTNFDAVILLSEDDSLKIPEPFSHEKNFFSLHNPEKNFANIRYDETTRELTIQDEHFFIEKNSILACEIWENGKNCEKITWE